MKKGLTCGTFDLLHTGHILMLKDAKSKCDYLICCLQINPSFDRLEKNTPIQTLNERYIQLSAVKYVDEIIVYETETDLEILLNFIEFDIRILGIEYKYKEYTGKDYCINNKEIYYNSRNHEYSSSGLRKRIKNEQLVREFEIEKR